MRVAALTALLLGMAGCSRDADAGAADAEGTDEAAQETGVREALPLGEGRPAVDGITRTQLRDDERAAVTRVHFLPGAAEPLHTHDFDLMVIPISGGPVEWRFGDQLVERLAPGEVQYVPAGTVHQFVNVGHRPFEVIAVAIK